MKHEIDFTSPTWRAIEAMAEKRVATLREANDSFQSTEQQTAIRRGQIAVWKEVLALAKAPAMDANELMPLGD